MPGGTMAKEINNNLSGRIEHTHPVGEAEMQPDILRAHLVKYHGWTMAMLFMGRNQGNDGVGYMRAWHRGDHKPMANPQ